MFADNSTISGNSAVSDGGGILLESGSARLFFSTVAANRADVEDAAAGSGGGIRASEIGQLELYHTIVAGNLRGPSMRDDIAGHALASYSLIGDGSGATIDDVDDSLIGIADAPIDPLLGPLADNGGPTWTHELLPGSLAIDAGDPGAADYAPPNDQRGAPHERIRGDRIDIGAFESEPAVGEAIDLAVQPVTAPPSVTAGQLVTVHWSVVNNGAAATPNSWVDAVYLTAEPTLGPQSIFVGYAPHEGTLQPGQGYASELTFELPAILGDYFVVVQTDARHQTVDVDRSDNVEVAAAPMSIGVSELSLGVPVDGQFTAAGDRRIYKVQVQQGKSLQVVLDSASAGGATALYVSRDVIPTHWAFDVRGSTFEPDSRLTVPLTHEGTYYVLAEGQFGDAATAPFTLVAFQPEFSVDEVAPNRGGNAGPVTTEIRGTLLDDVTEVRLVRGDIVIPAMRLTAGDSTRLYATFDLANQEGGTYDVVVINTDDQIETVSNGFEIVAGGTGAIRTELITPNAVRRDRNFSFQVRWTNDGLIDAPAPLLRVASTTSLGFSPGDDSLGTMYTFLGISDDGPPGTIRPGQTVEITFYSYSVPGITTFFVDAEAVFSDLDQPFDYESYRPLLIPPDMTSEEFQPIFAQLVSQIGPTNGNYLKMLGRNANLLPSEVGDNRFEVDLLGLELRKAQAAVGTSISGNVISPTSAIPVAGVRMTALNKGTGETFETTTLNDGSLIFEAVTPGLYEIRMRESPVLGASNQVLVAAGEALTGITIDLEIGATVSGRVTAAGANVVDAQILVYSDEELMGVAATNPAGEFAIRNLLPGTYTLQVDALGLARALVDITVSTGAQLLQISLQPQARVSGTATLADGQPIQDLFVVGAREGDGPLAAYLAVVHGSDFELGSLADGVYDFTVFHLGYDPVILQDIGVAPGSVLDLGAVELQPTGSGLEDAGLAATQSISADGLQAPAAALPLVPVIPIYLVSSWLAFYSAVKYLLHRDADLVKVHEDYFYNVLRADENFKVPPNVNRPINGRTFDNKWTDAALEKWILPALQTWLPDVQEIRDFLENYDPCHPNGFEHEFKLSELAERPEFQKDPVLSKMISVDNGSTELYKLLWTYFEGNNVLQVPRAPKGVFEPASIVAGGVGLGGAPPVDVPDITDARKLGGDVDVKIFMSGTAFLFGDFRLHVQDTFDFDPGGDTEDPIAEYFVALGRLFESLNVTYDVPVFADVRFDRTARFAVKIPNRDCGNPIRNVQAFDPNEIVGPDGFGPEQFLSDEAPLAFTINFENDPDNATAPAQEVVISHQLDTDLDWTTFELGEFGFGSLLVPVPAGLQEYQTRVDYQNQDGSPLFVDVHAGLDLPTGVVTWAFRSVDPATGTLPEGVFDGFLPVNDDTGTGEGFVNFRIVQKSGLGTGTAFDQQASIVFDANEPILTNVWTNTVDAAPPTSVVEPLPSSTSGSSFLVTWSGEDDAGGSGIAGFNIYVSVDGGAFTLWQSNTPDVSAEYPALVGEHTYAFISQAIDNVGHVEALRDTADTMTIAVAPPPQVTGVLVSGTSWSQEFVEFLQSSGQGNGRGYAIPVGPGAQLKPLGWNNLNQIHIAFSTNVDVEQSDLVLAGINVAEYDFSGFSYDEGTFAATWTLAGRIAIDRLTLTLDGHTPAGVGDQGGNLLDGDWSDDESLYPSGDGQSGSDFVFRFNVLVGDSDGDGTVGSEDYSMWADHYLESGPLSPADGDFNADGVVDGGDYTIWADSYQQSLPSLDGLSPAAIAPAASTLPQASSPHSLNTEIVRSIRANLVDAAIPIMTARNANGVAHFTRRPPALIAEHVTRASRDAVAWTLAVDRLAASDALDAERVETGLPDESLLLARRRRGVAGSAAGSNRR